jgi:glycosyltransferase involved in cell wall biosynthesis
MSNEDKKIRLGIVSDSPCVDTGYGKISKEVFRRILLTNKFEISQLGFWHRESTHHNPKWPLHRTKVDPNGVYNQKDKYGAESFDLYYEKYKPQIVWSTGDPWSQMAINNSKYRNEFRHIYYMPVDYEYVTNKIADLISKPDKIISYTKYGSDVLNKHFNSEVKYITPGVDKDIYLPYSDRVKWRESILGMTEDDVVFGFFSRNNPRKNLYAVMEALNIVRNKKGYKNIYLYTHCFLHDNGPNMQYMLHSMDLIGAVFNNPDIKTVGAGLSERNLATIMNACDVCFLPSMREGFGMTGLETMACGRKTYVTRCTGMLEYGIDFLEPKTHTMDSEFFLASKSYFVDPNDIADIMIKEYENRHSLPGPNIPSYKKAREFSWDNIAVDWFNVILSESKNIFKGKPWQLLSAI